MIEIVIESFEFTWIIENLVNQKFEIKIKTTV